MSSRVDKDRKRSLLRNHGFTSIFESNVSKVPVPSGGHAQMMSAEERGVTQILEKEGCVTSFGIMLTRDRG